MTKLLTILMTVTFPAAVAASPLFATEFQQAASKHGVPMVLLRAVCSVESSLNPEALVLHDGAGHSIGLCQVQANAAEHVGIKVSKGCRAGAAPLPSCNLWKPSVNIDVAARYLAYQYERYDKSWSSAIVSYNAGSVRRLPDGRYVNQRYLDKVIDRLAFFGDFFFDNNR